MDDCEVRLRCLELASKTADVNNRYPEGIVAGAKVYYSFAYPVPSSEKTIKEAKKRPEFGSSYSENTSLLR